MPGNRHFQGTVEYATLINFYFGPVEHIVGQLLLYGAIQSQAMNNIVLSAQTFDNIFVDLFHKTCGVTLARNGLDFGWKCFSNDNSTSWAVDASVGGSPFGDQPMLFTLGLLAVILLCFPLAISGLDDNIQVQIVCFGLSLLVLSEWMIESSFGMQLARVPTAAASSAFGGILGPIILNFACTIFVPSWINLKSKTVNAQKTIWTAMGIAILFFTLVGLFPALGFNNLRVFGLTGSSMNVITILTDPTQAHHLAVNKIFCYLFTTVMLLPAIPVSFIISEQNLSQNFRMEKLWQQLGLKLMVFVVPWLLVIPLQTGSVLASFINWTGVLLVSPANFVIPFVIYLKCLKFRRDYNEHRVLTPKQTSILKQVHANSTTIIRYLDTGILHHRNVFGFGNGTGTIRQMMSRGRTLISDNRTTSQPATLAVVGSIRRSASPSGISAPPSPMSMAFPPSAPRSRSPSPSGKGVVVMHQTLRGPMKVVEHQQGLPVVDVAVEEMTEDSSLAGGTPVTRKVSLLVPPSINSYGAGGGGGGRSSTYPRRSLAIRPEIVVDAGHLRVPEEHGFLVASGGVGGASSSHVLEEVAEAGEVEEFWLKEAVPDAELERMEHRLLETQQGHRMETQQLRRRETGGRQQRDSSPFGSLLNRGHSNVSATSRVPQIIMTRDTIRKKPTLTSRETESEVTTQEQDASNVLRIHTGTSNAASKRSNSTSTFGISLEPEIIPFSPASFTFGREEEGEQLNVVTPKSSRRMPQRQIQRAMTLPTNAHYVSETFIAVPFWLPVTGYQLAIGLLLSTSLLSLVVIVLQIVSASS
ncbi:hypothetical protein HDU79_004821 [Rhizoclosmatium sp. JEL0117]|nr:hypothetical protein HDU79_004821 [Rhizoclosmatium sp. JEL0117]